MTTREDPRRLNCQFSLESVGAHVKGYADALSNALAFDRLASNSTLRLRKLKACATRRRAALGCGKRRIGCNS